MARSFTSTNRAETTSAIAPTTSGCVSFWFKPTWNYNDSAGHFVWTYYDSTNAVFFEFTKWVDNKAYIGWYKSGTDYRTAVVTNSTMFSSGVWAHHVVNYENATPILVWKVNNVSKGTSAHANITGTLSQLDIGNDNTYSYTAGGTVADFCCWNTNLGDAEITSLYNGFRPYLIKPANVIGYYPLDGIESPEPDLSGNGKNLTLTGTAKANGPSINMMTRRRPMFCPYDLPGSFQPAWGTRSNQPVLGTGIF